MTDWVGLGGGAWGWPIFCDGDRVPALGLLYPMGAAELAADAEAEDPLDAPLMLR